MNTAERRNEILNLLQNADAPVAARKLASQFGVSRQVIVQDMAVIRAATPGILSTTRGYVIQQDSSCVREFKVRHESDQNSRRNESDRGLWRQDLQYQYQHRVYGRVSAEMDIRSRQDVNEFITAFEQQ